MKKVLLRKLDGHLDWRYLFVYQSERVVKLGFYHIFATFHYPSLDLDIRRAVYELVLFLVTTKSSRQGAL